MVTGGGAEDVAVVHLGATTALGVVICKEKNTSTQIEF